MQEAKKTFISIKDMAFIALFTAITAVCAWISIPIGPVPFTLQTFALFAALFILGGKRGTISILLYVILGGIGVPVFSSFRGGVSVLVGTTGGYIWGFIFAALFYWLIESLLKEKFSILFKVASIVFGCVIYYAIGTAWYAYISNVSFWAGALICVLPFILPDILKIVLAIFVGAQVKKALKI